MRTPLIELPSLQALAHSLSAMLNSANSDAGQVSILAREPNFLESSFPSEIITCQLGDGSKLRLLCKYSAGYNHNSHGHRGGIAYEAEVYRQVLKPLRVSAPRLYGTHKDASTGEMWIILEYVENSVRVKDSLEIAIMTAAAHWLGRFHRANEPRLLVESLPFLKRHDAEYYLGWAERTSLFASRIHPRYPWLVTLCRRFEEVVDELLEPPTLIIHGEYYPNNILFSQGDIYPVDWESTAVGTGEIDLVSLTEGWPAEFVTESRAEYQAARWPEGAPADFDRKLEAAQLYWLFRWLGDRPEWTARETATRRFERLRSTGERMGLI